MERSTNTHFWVAVRLNQSGHDGVNQSDKNEAGRTTLRSSHCCADVMTRHGAGRGLRRA